MKALDLAGKRFGRLVAVRRIGVKASHVLWLCRCDCGKDTKSAASNLSQGLARSCGCVAAEKAATRRRTHGRTRTPEYRAWCNMIARCENRAVKHYPSYGGAGIAVCPEWRGSFASFYQDMGPRPSSTHSVDRIDGALGYFKSNCRWATTVEQAGNRKSSIQVVHGGERKCLKAACEALGLDYRKSLYLFRKASELPEGVYRYETVGKAILRYQAEVNRRAMETGAHEFEWDGVCVPDYPDDPTCEDESPVRVLACNTIVFNSQFFDGFYDPKKHDVMCAHCRLANGKWKVSLYSTKPEIDCGEICKAFGGGGHKGAAGFICDRLPWDTK